MIAFIEQRYTYSTTQTSTDRTVDTYWDMVNNRYINIHNKVSYSYSVDWINGCIQDIGYGIHHCQYIKDTAMRNAYIQQFTRIRNELNLIKEELTSCKSLRL